MRAESVGREQLRVGRIQDKARWTKALGEAATVVYGDCNEDIDLSNRAALLVMRGPAVFELTTDRNQLTQCKRRRAEKT